MPVFLIYAACAFASGFALRLVDPIVLPVAAHFAVTPAAAAMLNTAYALPYALAQPFLGPIGDRFGKQRCVQFCIAALALALAAGAFANSFALLLATRVLAGIFAGGLIPLVLAGLGDTYAMSERQVMLGRMLFAIISGQMLGSVVSGFANVAFGWHSSLFIASGIGTVAAIVAWTAMPVTPKHADAPPPASFAALYGRVFANPKAAWLYGAVMLEGALFYGLFPFMSELLVATTARGGNTISVETGIVLGAFGPRLGGGAVRLRLLHRPGPRTAGLRRLAACARAAGLARPRRRGDRRPRPGRRRPRHRPAARARGRDRLRRRRQRGGHGKKALVRRT